MKPLIHHPYHISPAARNLKKDKFTVIHDIDMFQGNTFISVPTCHWIIIGIMAIEIAGAVYCPLSPQDPLHRLHTLVEQTNSRLVLVHAFTREIFDGHHAILDMDLVLNMSSGVSDNDRDRLSHVAVSGDNIGYIIFTSGSTGTPKAVQVRQRNFLEAIRSLVEVGTFSENDTVAQIVRCSFDIHVEDIIGTLIVGATLVMLHPEGPMDFEYLGQVLVDHHVTYIHAVPTLLTAFFIYLQQNGKRCAASSLRSICCIGEPFPVKLIAVLKNSVESTCRIWNLYGPAETTLVATYHVIALTSEMRNIPIGWLLPGYQCVIVDEFSQPVTVGEVGELLVGGVGVFAGYLGRKDLTDKALVDIDGQLFYRTGDLVRLERDDLLYYVGRKDHQIKLRGQRLEPGEIERCVLEASSLITSCVVVKWGDDHLVAYVQSDNINEKELRKHCESHLPSYMVPSVFTVLKQLPLNANGKVDRQLLPIPNFSPSTTFNNEHCGPLTPLEELLAAVFVRAFHVEALNVNASFGQLGGTSIDAIFALSLIRQEVYPNMEIGLLLENPSVRQLARALQPLLVGKPDENEEEKEVQRTETIAQLIEDQRRPAPSLFIEAVGIVFLICQWLYPILIAYYSSYRLTCLLVPVSHLLSYVVCRRLLFWSNEESERIDLLYSWRYYRWLFLERLWSINNSYWLQHLLGTSFYNSYLRLCGARVGRGVQIYSTWIDAPWLLDVGESTFIGSGTIVSSLLYHDQAYELQPISIGSHCSIGTRCVLYGEVKMQDYVHMESMSVVTGCYSSANGHASIKDRSFAWHQTVYQLVCLLCLATIHGTLLALASLVYGFFVALWVPAAMALALSWLFWSITGLFVVLFSLKFIVGPLTPGKYSINCYSFLHKLWLRQLLISSFHHSYEVLSSFNAISNVLLRWLGAHIEHDVKLAEFQPVLQFPSNLLKIERSATTFAGVTLAPFEVTSAGDCHVDIITLGSATNLGNVCTLLPGVRLAPNTVVGNLTRVTEETQCSVANTVLLGIPSRPMPFVMPDPTTFTKDASLPAFPFLHTLMANCSVFLFGKFIFIATYSLLPTIIAPFVQVIISCVAYHCLVALMGTKSTLTYSETITHVHQFISTIMSQLNMFVGPFLSQTQYLVFLLRALGAHIGRDVILPNLGCLTDPHLVTIGDHVRLHSGASLQSHTFEQRLFKLAPVTVNQSSVLMSYSNVLAGSTLHGRNRLLPFTLVMKNDQLALNTMKTEEGIYMDESNANDSLLIASNKNVEQSTVATKRSLQSVPFFSLFRQ
ncbi:unnamed protein product [Adineta ricciae]|uniref:Carrier domain-containing protein n=1 Tax=Adineta ricciae TaxID=249248 RepID=A0A814RGD9_ADIRI|nr:unnamed protein product [Adineta ricciae]